jgi:MoaA/NifB/PqqE/SkfB family radical SAM enzyme
VSPLASPLWCFPAALKVFTQSTEQWEERMTATFLEARGPFASPRGGSNLWATHDDIIDAFRSGDQIAVPPITMEFAPTNSCDLDCPLCPYRRSRSLLEQGRVGDGYAPTDDTHSASWDTAKRVLEKAKAAGVCGVLWTGGGEPLVWPHLVPGLTYSASLGLLNCLYTNGFRIGSEPGLARELLHPRTRLVFLRVSLNALSPVAMRRHWGMEIAPELQLAGLASLLAERARLSSRYRELGRPVPSIQISTIADKNTVDDLPAICESVAGVFARSPVRGHEDVMIVRPLTVHGRKQGFRPDDHADQVIRKIIAFCGASSPGSQALAASGVHLFLGFGLPEVESGAAGRYGDVIAREYASRDVSLANGVFLTVGPSGDVYPSTEHNCDPAWSLGSLRTSAVAEIYAGRRRRAILDKFNSVRWGPTVAQPTARTNRLDRIARLIRDGHLGPAQITAIRDYAKTQHPGVLLD